MTDLKPCPLCGSTDVHVRNHPTFAATIEKHIVCANCRLTLPAQRDEGPRIAAWNQRSTEAAYENLALAARQVATAISREHGEVWPFEVWEAWQSLSLAIAAIAAWNTHEAMHRARPKVDVEKVEAAIAAALKPYNDHIRRGDNAHEWIARRCAQEAAIAAMEAGEGR
jgi:Lar family restriction alleviation protein